MSDKFQWDEERGVGFYPVSDPRPIYNNAYFLKYVGYANAKLGKALTKARVDFVRRYVKPDSRDVVDIGIGSGQFIEAREHTYGYDVNPMAIRYLLGKGKWWDPYTCLQDRQYRTI